MAMPSSVNLFSEYVDRSRPCQATRPRLGWQCRRDGDKRNDGVRARAGHPGGRRRLAMRALLATALILGGVLVLSACTTEEEAEESPTATAKASAQAVVTKTATPAGAAASPR